MSFAAAISPSCPPIRRPLEAAAIEQILIDGKDICDLNIERLKASHVPESEERESDELLRQLRRLVHFLMTGEDSTEDAPFSSGRSTRPH